MHENTQLKGRVAVLTDRTTGAELEVKACRETISRMAEEAEGRQHHLSHHGHALEVLKQVK
jgi:hypothetical protein